VVQIAAGSSPVSFDLGLTTSTTTQSPLGFDLAGLYASTPGAAAGVHNVAVEGDLLLNSVPAGAISFFNLPANTLGGVQLPLDDLGAVAVTGHVPARSVNVHSVRGVAFGSVTADDGFASATQADEDDADQVLTPTTAMVQANGNFRVPFTTQPVALFLATEEGGGGFDEDRVLFYQVNTGTPQAPATALVKVVVTHDEDGRPEDSVIQEIDFSGNDASVQTGQWASTAITSAGPLGDLILSSPQGLTANVTAPSIIGNIDATWGAISGTVETTVGDLGRTHTDANGNITGVTSVHAGYGGLTGKILVKGNLISQVTLQGDLNGVIAADGDIRRYSE
jgi:hypothetical protein